MKTIAEIRARREQMVAEAARQRGAIALQYVSMEGPANVLGKGLDAVDWLRRNPLVLGVAAAVLIVMRPRRALRLASRGVLAWRSVSSIRNFLREAGVAL